MNSSNLGPRPVIIRVTEESLTTMLPQNSSPNISDEITRDYRIIRLLGRGGMGEVYLAEQLRVGSRRVALKILKHALSADPDMVRRFENEAASAGRIDHPNIIRVYECRATSTGQIYVAMEYCDGESLRDLLKKEGQLSLPAVADITKEVAAGLNAAHQAGIIHRDVKPDNIMVIEHGGAISAKVVDFGIARLTNQAHPLTQDGTILGSASYMSPEQASGLTGDKIDARADVYSLGMVVYEMLTGRVAFKGVTWAELIHKQIYEKPPSPTQFKSDIPVAVERVVLKALEKNPAERYYSATGFAKDLEVACRAGGQAISGQQNTPIGGNQVSTPSSGAGAGKQPNVADGQPASGRKKTGDMHNTPKDWNPWVKYFCVPLLIVIIGLVLSLALQQWLKERQPDKQNPEVSNGEKGRGRPPEVTSQNRENTNLPTTTSTSPPHPEPRTEVLSYQVERKEPTRELNTLAEDNAFRTLERIRVRIESRRPGWVYLLLKMEGGGMQWMNPIATGGANKPQYCAADERVTVPTAPEGDYFFFKDRAPQQIIIIYVPVGLTWSLQNLVHPQNMEPCGDYLCFPQEAATRVMGTLKDAKQLSDSPAREGRNITHNLAQSGDEKSVSYAQINLVPEPQLP
jgi:serine/threonine protein kinase